MRDRERYESPELVVHENLKEMTKLNNVISPVNGNNGKPKKPRKRYWPNWPS